MAHASFPRLSAPESDRAPASSVCLGCSQAVDPLRAGHVAVLGGRFRYFCRSECKQAYLAAVGRPQEEEVATIRPPDVTPSFPARSDEQDVPASRRLANGWTPEAVRPQSDPPLPIEVHDAGLPASGSEPLAEGGATAELLPEISSGIRSAWPSGILPSPLHARGGAGPERRAELAIVALDVTGVVFGFLAPAIGLLGSIADVARLPLVMAAWGALALRVALVRRDPADPHPLVVIVPTAGATAAACVARFTHDPRAVALLVLAGLSCASAIVAEWLVGRARARTTAERERIEHALDVRVRVVHGEDALDADPSEVRPGEQVVVVAGEVVGVDARVTAGEARVVPWLDSLEEVTKREGDPLVAGARVLSSRLRVTTTWSGRERAWVKLLASPSTRIDVNAPTPRWLRHTVERGAPLAALLVGVAAFSANATAVEIVAAMCAAGTAFAAKAVSSVVALHFSRAHLEALASGITYKDARAFERAASANVAVLSARGTVLLGEPEIVAVEPVGTFEMERVLSLAAGAETASTHPFAAAVLQAARTRGIRADHVRNATAHVGLGVTASASSGERLVVGGRAIMLEEKIGVAVVDARVSELEGQGRSVLLVGLGDRIVGLIALQDGLRPGARAAVQRLLDARIEPVLLSGEARDTCETIGRALDIEHVRPEVLPADRGAEVRALAEGGNVVAVIGHPAGDDSALGAADVAVAMGAAGSTPGEWSVSLAGDHVRDAAMALAIPRAARDRARAAIALGATPGLVAVLAIGFGIAPLAVAPLAALIGAVAVAVHARPSLSG